MKDKEPIVILRAPVCERHKQNQRSYIAWHEWADKKTKNGEKQKRCPKCGRWYFKEEY